MRSLSLLLFLLSHSAFAQTYFEHHEQGWFWYERLPPKAPKKIEQIKSPNTTLTATQTMTSLQQNVAESLNRAILNPSQENLLHYANTYYQVINQGQHFTQQYKMMLLNHPEYDYYLRFPVNHNARIIHEREQQQANVKVIQDMAATHGFLFFFSSNCQYCHIFAPTVKRFAERYGIHVMAISMDGGFLKEFPHALPDNGIAKSLGVSRWPSLFAVNPRSRKVIPLANGVVSVSELEETILKYAQNMH